MGLVIDKLTGQIYLFDIPSSTGGTGSGSTMPYLQVNVYAQLPNPALNNGKIYVVLQPSGSYMLGRHEAGMYYSNGIVWTRLGDIPSFFNSNNFQVYDGTDTTKAVKFQLSGLTSNTVTTITMRNSSGTIAYLTDIGSKVDTSVFTGYTATTQALINTKLDKFVFNGYTASTNTRITNLENEVAGLTGGTSTVFHAIQVIDLVGGINVNNIAPTSILWTSVEFSGNSLSYTGGSRIYIQVTGQYEISYNLVLKNGNNVGKTIGSVIRINGTTSATPLSVATYIDNGSSITGSNNLANYKKTFNAGDYLELTAFRIGANGAVNTVAGASWIRIIKT